MQAIFGFYLVNELKQGHAFNLVAKLQPQFIITAALPVLSVIAGILEKYNRQKRILLKEAS